MIEHNKEYHDLKKALSDIGRFLKHGRQNLVTANPDEILEKFIPDSTLELEAIVKGTEKASNDIMDMCDSLEKAAATLDEKAREVILEHTAKIYASCGFQDITGQRANKVIRYLGEVEKKSLLLVKHLKDFFDSEDTLSEELRARAMAGIEEDSDTIDDKSLLNGPQLEGQGLTQAEIDAMLDDF